MPRRPLLFALVVLLSPTPAIAQPKAEALPPKAAADSLDGSPFVSAKAWAVADGKTGKVLWGFNEAESRPMASTTKIMTAWIVLRLAATVADATRRLDRLDLGGYAAVVSDFAWSDLCDWYLEVAKVELRVAKVLQAERVPKSTRLLKLLVDVGSEQRTIVAGIAESYEPETLVGRTVVVVFNLKPAKLMGIESNGMVLAASPEGGKATIVSFDEPPAPGTRVR